MEERSRPFNLVDMLGMEIPCAWEPADTAPDAAFPVVVHAIGPGPNGTMHVVFLVGSRIDGEWTLLGEVPPNHKIVEYFRLPMPPHLMKGRAN